MKNSYHFLAVYVIIYCFLPYSLFAQDAPAYAAENVVIHNSDGTIIESGTIIWRSGIIEAIGADIRMPFDAYSVIDGGDSLHVYPGFIDGLGTWGSPKVPQSPQPAEDPGNPGYERAGIQPNRSAHDSIINADSSMIEAMRAGIAVANVGLNGYMLAGQPDLFFLNGEDTPDYLLKESSGFQFEFKEAAGGWSNRAYPSTTMGVMAQFRQLMYDATALQDHIQYYAAANGSIQPPSRDKVLESLFPLLNGESRIFATVDSPENFERLLILEEEFNLDIVLVSGKSIYHKSAELAEREIPVLVSIELPDKPVWLKEQEQNNPDKPVSNEEKRFRERQAATYQNSTGNIRTLLDQGVKVGFSSVGLESDEILDHLRLIKKEGNVNESEILQILTSNTAEIVGVNNELGRLASGYNASFSIFDSAFLDEESRIQMMISNGEVHEF